jgi:hypothetical protein
MANTRSVDFLPEIFRTDVNKQFLAATLDVLVQEPRFKKIQGFVGRSVGPGVNPDDRYVVEPNKVRADYQLEPGVVSLKPDTDVIDRVMTYPNINDAVTFQGGDAERPDRLYRSDYYTWDPFVNFDSFVNFSQYYWLPNGPDAVEVAATPILAQEVIDVIRQDSGYTFSGRTGANPEIQLLRGGSYTFRVAQNTKQTINLRVGNRGQNAYIINGQDNPNLVLIRGNTYVFNLNLRGGIFPFWIKTKISLGESDAFDRGVTRNGSDSGLVTFVVPEDAPDKLYYASENRINMSGEFEIQDATPGTGPGFWIQSAPGVSGTLPTTPNITSRDVFGVTNNGADLGLITFNVPRQNAQQFFYNLTELPVAVDLVTGLKFDDINNRPVESFLQTYGGIDGVSSLTGRTLVFALTPIETQEGGWVRTTLFDPLPRDDAANFATGSFDTTLYDQATEIPVEDRRQLWQINTQFLNGVEYFRLVKISDIPQLNKFTVRYGSQYSSTQWYKSSEFKIETLPALTAVQDELYYQDSLDPALSGIIKLLPDDQDQTIFINDIIGKSAYTSRNGIKFSNGLKVVFRGQVEPPEFGSGTFEFECTATTPGTNAITTDTTEDLYVGQEIIFSSPTLGGLAAGQTYYVQSIINLLQFTVTTTPGGSSTSLQFGTGSMRATAINYREFYVSGVGTAIQLLPVENFVTPETYVVDADDSTIAIEPAEPDYITIDRSSQDRNAWSRSNRWFHVDIINATAEYNNTVAELDNRSRAKRPILEFRPGLRLFDSGTLGKDPVDIIDFTETDAFSNIEGSLGYTVDGVSVVNGTRIIFAADQDPDVRSKIFVVEFIIPDSIPPLIAQPVITLRLATDGLALVNDTTVCLQGQQNRGVTFWYDGIEWRESQQKTSVQQAPRFDVYDAAEVSFGDRVKYPSSNFQGSKLFSYTEGSSGILDPVLGLPLEYLNIANVGDIVFDNNLYKDTFVYTRDNVSETVEISQGFVRQYLDRTNFQRLLGWQNAVTPSEIYQQFRFVYDGSDLVLDIPIQSGLKIPSLKVYSGVNFLDPSTYTVKIEENTTTVTIDIAVVPGTVIEVLALSDRRSRVGFYQVPINLENNPFNTNSREFTLGTIRQHYESICQNLPGITGSINGSNNSRDLGNLVPYGLVILQQSAPLTLPGYFFGDDNLNIFNAIAFNSREYFKYKNLVLNGITEIELQFETPAEILDQVIESITQGRVENQPFYWSDMLPSGAVFLETVYPITPTSIARFDTKQTYNYRSANYLGLNVYFNDRILVRNTDYVVSEDGIGITVLIPLSVGDVITLREYSSTAGSFCPNTPSKMGLYPVWKPELVTVETSTGNQIMIRGHDGSLTLAFDDIRDDVLLEFERRIYNNIKLDGNPVPLEPAEVIPGQFRDTGYSFEEINSILAQDLLSYVAWNKLDYTQQVYRADNAFTYNYSRSQNKLDNQNLLGAWRGIYRYFYDVEQPNLQPWEMLGITVKPTWWDRTYGSAPYTRDNLVLWDDLEQGLVRDPAGAYIKPNYARPGLIEVLPTSGSGDLLPPLESVTGSFDSQQFRRSWVAGDGGPVEASWWSSSLYPFAVMRLLAITRPAKFFSLFADRDRYRYRPEFDQYLYDNRYRLDANGIEVYGDGVSKASYINWVVDYNRQTGLDYTDIITQGLKNLDVRLCYRMAGFSDKRYIRLLTDKATPDSSNTSFLIPDESYDLLLFKNQAFARATYSSVLVQRVPGGYSVFGYGTLQPYFNVLQSQVSGSTRVISAPGISVTVPVGFTDNVVRVPYGFVFDNETSVVDFLLSYGEFCKSQGLTFTNIDNGYELNWDQMAVEFLYWSQQGWQENALIALNPLASRLVVTRDSAVAESIEARTGEASTLDQNKRDLPTRKLNIVRLGNSLTVEPLTDQTLSFIDLNYTAYEHLLVLQNRSSFGDLIYDKVTGARQSRVNLTASVTADWNGAIDTPGFVLNLDNVPEWQPGRSYTKGEIVRYKDRYWSAATIVQPNREFNLNDWLQSDYEIAATGMLPNLANKADQLANSYNINDSNLDTEEDLFSYGLIGFRPRSYMASLNLDDVSQINVYRQFLGTKGTVQSAELFSNANLRKETADYSVYENWAVQRAIYGASANRRFFELRLNRALLDPNPSIVQVIEPQQSSNANQTVLLGDLWRQSTVFTTTQLLPTVTSNEDTSALPSAGYVNLDDADVKIFDLEDLDDILAQTDDISTGTSIWVAKVNEYEWNIYRTNPVPGNISHVCDNLDQTSLVFFNRQHGLAPGDVLIIRFFDPEVDGIYRVLTVPSLDSVTIAFSFTGNRTVVNGQGLGFTLEPMRVPQFSDAIDLSYADNLRAGDRVWVDDIGDGRWAVLEKRQVFSSVTELTPKELDAGERFGASVAQASNRFAALVGAPGHYVNDIQVGAVYVFVDGFGPGYDPVSSVGTNGDAKITLPGIDSRNLGASVTFGDRLWGAAGAPGSLGTGAAADNGYVDVIFYDKSSIGSELNIYQGSPTWDINVAYVSNIVVLSRGRYYQSLQSVPPGISIDDPLYWSLLTDPNPFVNWQLLVNPETLTAPSRFGDSVSMSADERWLYVGAPGTNKVYTYGRVDWQDQTVSDEGDGVTLIYDISDVIQIDQATQISVVVNGVTQILNTDYTVAPGFDTVTFAQAPALGAEVLISRINTIKLDTAMPVASYAIGASLFTAKSIDSFSVIINGNIRRPLIDYTFNSLTQTITFAVTPSANSSVVVRAQGYWRYAGAITVPGLASGSKFGASVATDSNGRQIIVGCPDDEVDGLAQAGSTYVFDRSVQRFVYQGGMPVSFTVLGSVTAPVSVSVNGKYLVNETSTTIGSPGSFAVAGNTITINSELTVGDFVEIETNQFRQLQKINQSTPAEFSNLGQTVAICPFDCTVFGAAPQSSVQVFKGGVVEVSVNQPRLYGTITSLNANPVLTPGDTIKVNEIDVVVPAPTPDVSSLAGLAQAITSSVPNASAMVHDGRLRVFVTNFAASQEFDRLQVSPGSVGTAYSDLGFDIYSPIQTVLNPYPQEYAAFGSSLSVSEIATELVVGAPNGTMYIVMIFDQGTMEFDADATIFYSDIPQSGAVYVYNLALSANASAANPAKFIFGQQIEVPDLAYLDRFGSSVSYRSGLLWTGAPAQDIGDSTFADFGKTYIFQNPTREPAWQITRSQQPSVDIRLLNSIFLYDVLSSATTEFLDFFDPLQGKIISAAQQNIDYVTGIDPASYNVGTNDRNSTWAQDHVGDVWWNLSTVRFVDPNQNDAAYSARQWAQVFPGSSVDVYQWIASDQLPAEYTGPGIPFSNSRYSVNTFLGNDGVINTQYFYWVRGITDIAINKGKTLSVDTVARYIENPRASGIAYLAPIATGTLALYNCLDLIRAQDTVLHVEFDREFNDDNVHVEYELIPQGRADGFLADNLYLKLQDSFCGADSAGNRVPDIFLSPPERYGVQFRPRQSMFINRFEALKNYIIRANLVMKQFPISEIRRFNLLNSSEPPPLPAEQQWNLQVPNLEILSFQDLNQVPLGYRYLVDSDASQSGRWSIYEVVPIGNTGFRELRLARVQIYVTKDFWQFIDWYEPGYNPSTRPVAEIPNLADLANIQIPVGSSVKVTANSQGKFEIYQNQGTEYRRVGLQDGTIEISNEIYDYVRGRFGYDIEVFDAQYFDQEPVIETRKIIQALNQEIFIDDLLIERNRLLTLMFDFVLSESLAPEWLVKTSLIDVDHRIRELIPFQNFTRDNQEFVLDYISEVKPYHVQIREFNIKYFGNDVYLGDMTDFDLPAYFDTSLQVPQYVSPILLPYERGTAQVSNILSDVSPTSTIWQTWPWNQWFSNYLLDLVSIRMTSAGTGYTGIPQIQIQGGDAERPAQARAVLDGSGGILAVVITDPGSGYRSIPTVVFVGGNGSGAAAYAEMRNEVIRQPRITIKYDRYQYRTSVLPWSPDGTYENGILVRYRDQVWRAENSDGSSANVGPDFNPEDWIPVPASELSGVDRTMGFYVAGVDSPGLDLPLLIDGVSYPGVQVWGDYFIPTETRDVNYQSSFQDLFLGTRPTDINVDGGEFIGPYEGHAPEELVNGSEFDTLDLRVFTRSGSDWQIDGHGFDVRSKNFIYDAVLSSTFDWSALLTNPVAVLVSNQASGRDLSLGIDYVIDWTAQTLSIIPGPGSNDGDVINVAVYGAGGGSQLYQASFLGTEAPQGVFFIPVSANEISEIAVFLTGDPTGTPSFEPYIDSVPWDSLDTYQRNQVVKDLGVFYRALQNVPLGIPISNIEYWFPFVPTLLTQVTLPAVPGPDDRIVVLTLGPTTVAAPDLIAGRQYAIQSVGTSDFVVAGAVTNTVGEIFTATQPVSGSGLAYTDYSWSTPQTQYVIADAGTVSAQGFTLDNNLSGVNIANMVVTRNGFRLTPPAGIEWFGDDTSVSFGLPQRLGTSFQQSSIDADTDIQVWVDDILQTPNVGLVLGDYGVTAWDGSNTPGRQVVFNSPPRSGARIQITVNTLSSYSINNDFLQLDFIPNLGDVFAVTTWNDTSQQDLLTNVFVGPSTQGFTVVETYDSTNFDPASINFQPGSFDYSAELVASSNDFVLDRVDIDPTRIWVTLNGRRLFDGQDYVVDNDTVILASGTIGSADVLAVTMYTNSLVPPQSAFRIFQDMRGIQATYRITPGSTTELAAPLALESDAVFVADTSGLTVPNLAFNILGTVMVGAERIAYREIDFSDNSLRGLLRGTAGTGISEHATGTTVTDIGRGNLLPEQYQDSTVSDTSLGDGSTVIFFAPSLNYTTQDDNSTVAEDSIEVYVGGERQLRVGQPGTSRYRWFVTDFEPLAIEFVGDFFDPSNPDSAPPSGVEVTILQRRGVWWYDIDTAAQRQQALQESQSDAARFLTGRNGT